MSIPAAKQSGPWSRQLGAFRAILAVMAALPGGCFSEQVAGAESDVLIEWRFDLAGELLGWSPGRHVADVSVGVGGLRGRATDRDPSLVGPVFDIPARATQWVEVRLRASQGGRAELFWTETLEGPYGGFAQEKTASFPVAGGDAYRDYRIPPFWQSAGRIIRLRFDPPSVDCFEIAHIRILDSPQPETSASSWDFRRGGYGWTGWQSQAAPVADAAGLGYQAGGHEAWLISPALEIPAEEYEFLAIRMAVEAGKRGRVFFGYGDQVGRDVLEFPLRADGRMHTYYLDVASLPRWEDSLVLLGIQASDQAGAAVRMESVVLSGEPMGPPEVHIDFFGSTEGVVRAGRPFAVRALLSNQGGRSARSVTVSLAVPDGVEVLNDASQQVGELERLFPASVHWQVRSAEPGEVRLSLELRAEDELTGERLPPMGDAVAVPVTPLPAVSATDYVPEPHPVRSDIDLGVYYFPGWDSWSRWRPILDFPDRKPVLGWYDEADPECADWQIKWAVEHGVRFFMVDWYWDRGNRQLEHWLHQAYDRARYRHHLQWALMWANHNAAGSHSKEDWRQVTQYWLDHYFPMEEYYRIEGRPAVFIWAPANIRQDVGGSESAAELYAMSQEMAQQAGYEGIYFIALSSHESAAQCQQLRAEGYRAFTSYHGFYRAAERAEGRQFSFSEVVETGLETWRLADQRASGLHSIPIIDTGWASEPWHGLQARVIHGRTPELFGELCRLAAEYARENDKSIVAVGPWNEWGEGSYIEPCAAFGFRNLEALRRAFCPPGDWPPSLVPADVGRGPYDLEPLPLRTAWRFSSDSGMQGWTPNGAFRVQATPEGMRGDAVGEDPILIGPGVRLPANRYRQLVVRMSSSRAEVAQLFWATAVTPVSEANSVHFPVAGDGIVREYRIDLSQSRRWRGVITGVRFDPVMGAGARVHLESLRFEP